MGWGALIGAGASLVGSFMSGDSAAGAIKSGGAEASGISSNATAAAVSSAQEGGKLANIYAGKFGNEALGYLNNYNTRAQAAVYPQVQGSYTALDNYFDLLGMQRPKIGNAAVAKQNLDYEMHRTELQNKISTAQAGIDAANFTITAAANTARAVGETKGAVKGWAEYDRELAHQQAIQQGHVNTIHAAEAELKGMTGLNFEMNDPQAAKAGVLQALQNTPGYNFAVEQGGNALTNLQNAGGYLNSGRAQKEAIRYGQGMAEQLYNNAVQQNAQAAGLTGSFAGQSSNMYGVQAGAGAQTNMNIGAALANNYMNTGQLTSQYYMQGGQDRASIAANTAGGLASIYGGQANMLGGLASGLLQSAFSGSGGSSGFGF